MSNETHRSGRTLIARLVAAAVSLGTFVFLFLTGSWRSDNPFLIPDLVVCALLLAAALTPHPRATPGLPFALGAAAGVLGAAFWLSTFAGPLALGALVGAVASALGAALLMLPRGRSDH